MERTILGPFDLLRDLPAGRVGLVGLSTSANGISYSRPYQSGFEKPRDASLKGSGARRALVSKPFALGTPFAGLLQTE